MEAKTPFPLTTLEAITQQKEDTIKEIRKQERVISGLTKNVFSMSEPVVTKGQTVIRMLNISTTFFKGIMFGVQLSKKIKKLFHHQRSKKAAS